MILKNINSIKQKEYERNVKFHIHKLFFLKKHFHYLILFQGFLIVTLE